MAAFLRAGIVGLAVLISIASSLFTLAEAPNSWRSSASYRAGDQLMAENPGPSLIAILNAYYEFPFDQKPRRDVFINVGKLAERGIIVDPKEADKLYRISQSASAHAPNLLSNRLVWLLFSGHATSDRRDEAQTLIGLLKGIAPRLENLGVIERMLAA